MLEAIEEAIVGYIKPLFDAAFPTVVVCWPNSPFDWNNPPERHVMFEVETFAGDQIGASVSPKTRIRGFVYVEVRVREGLGTKPVTSILDWFAGQLEYKYLTSTVRTTLEAPEPDGSSGPKGWYSRALKVPFFSDPV